MNRAYFFGGGGFRKKLNDLFAFDCKNKKWINLNVQGFKPTSRNKILTI